MRVVGCALIGLVFGGAVGGAAFQPPSLGAIFGGLALHAGPVTTGEVGGSRRAIVFHGDVMNTASRLENATRELERPFLASDDALTRLDGTGAYALVDLGSQQLRGRAQPVRV